METPFTLSKKGPLLGSLVCYGYIQNGAPRKDKSYYDSVIPSWKIISPDILGIPLLTFVFIGWLIIHFKV